MITDLAPVSINAMWAALIAREQGASLRLLHVGGARRRMAQVHEALEDFRKQVHARLGIELRIGHRVAHQHKPCTAAATALVLTDELEASCCNAGRT